MTTPLRPPEGQQCECNEDPEPFHPWSPYHDEESGEDWACCDRSEQAHVWPNHGGQLKRVYWEKNHRMCFAWWCANCYSWLDEHDEDWEPWPTGEDGRFVPSVHCQTIPGLD